MQRMIGCLLLVTFLCLTSCSPQYNRFITGISPTAVSQPDYNDLHSWAAHPLKNDPGDSIPSELQSIHKVDSSASVFFIHPTTFTNRKDTAWNASLQNDTLNTKTDYSTILYQASAFNDYLLFAPRYRQAHLRAYFSSDTARAREALDFAYEDIKSAFRQYLISNPSGPIVIAAHSQGSTHALRLLNDFFQQGALRERLVVAYVIGMHIPSAGNIPLCKDSTATGCICAWRTYKSGYIPSFIQKEIGPAYVTNPLSWKTNELPVSRTMNKGSVVRNFRIIYPQAADAMVHERVLWVSTIRFPGSLLIRKQNYHVGDINLFYMNIKENVKTRVNHFLKRE